MGTLVNLTDYVNIYDGNSAFAPLVTTLYTDMMSPLPSYVTSQQYMFIRFVSNSSTVDNGFNMTYTSDVTG